MKPTICIVEDDFYYRSFLDNALNMDGYKTFSFDCPTQALSFIEHNHENIDLVISDIMMPMIDGVELIKSISKFHPKLKTCVISAKRDQQDIDSLLAYGCFHFFEKGVGLDTILEKVRQIIFDQSISEGHITFLEPSEAQLVSELKFSEEFIEVYSRDEYPVGGFLKVSSPKLREKRGQYCEIVDVENLGAGFKIKAKRVG